MPLRPPLRLRCLGGPTLERDPDALSALPVQRLPFLALALVATAGPRGIPRDRVAALLWPESDEERARHSLRQTLYTLRRRLGEDAIVLEHESLRLDRRIIEVDVLELQEAVAARDHARAVALYAGPFLDGVRAGESVELERWIDDERRRLERLVAGALEALAADATRARDHGAAAAWLRRLAALEPTSSRAAAALMRALAGAGDPAAALEHGRVHETLLREQLDVAPDREVVELTRRLRAEAAAAALAHAPVAPAPAARPDTASDEAHRADPAPAVITTPAPSATDSRDTTIAARRDDPVAASATSSRSSRWASSRLVAVIALVAAVVTMAAIAALRGPLRAERAGVGPSWVRASSDPPTQLVVLPFTMLGDTSEADVGEAAAAMLAAEIDGGAGVHVPDIRRLARTLDHSIPGKDAARVPSLDDARAVADSLGAPFLALGEIVTIGDSVRLSVTIHRTTGSARPEALARAAGRRDQLLALADSLAIQLLAARSAREPGRLVSAAASTTQSLAAFKAYLEGERSFHEGRYGAALAAYRRATTLDSLFALAYYRRAMVADWASLGGTTGDVVRARALADRLPMRERRLVMADGAWEDGDVAAAERMLRRTLELYPNDPQASYQLGEVIFHSGPLLGRAPFEARPFFARVVEMEPYNVEALAHLARIEVARGRIGVADSLVERARSLRPHGDRLVTELAIMLAMARGDRRAIGALLSRRPADEDALLYLIAWRLSAYTDSTGIAAPLARRLATRSADPNLRMRARLRLAESLVADGRLADALRACDDPALGSAAGLGARAYFVALRVSGASRTTIAAYADSLDRWTRAITPDGLNARDAAANGSSTRLAAYPRALLALRLGDTAAASRSAASLARLSSDTALGPLARALASSVEAELAWTRGETNEAIARLDSSTVGVPLQLRLDLFGGLARERFRRAEMLRAVGRDDEARRWYASLDGGDTVGERAFASAVARALAAPPATSSAPSARRSP